MASRSRAGSICEQPGDFQLDSNSLYSKICLGKVVRNNREFVIPVFVICMNAYNGKDRKKYVRKKLFNYIRQFNCLLNLSLEEGIVPSEWKKANITPLFKKGSKNEPENYRPVSLTSVVCKLIDTLIGGHMVEFLVKHKLINTSQHGFLKARSCLTNLLCFFKEITKCVDDGSPVDVVYLDFQKAFDKVPRQRLLLKLIAHGIGNVVINWIEKWLTHRRQRVVVDGEISN